MSGLLGISAESTSYREPREKTRADAKRGTPASALRAKAAVKATPIPRVAQAPKISEASTSGTRRAQRLRSPEVCPLFDCWDEVARRTHAARDIRLFLDFDGTLVDFRSRPDQVSLGEDVRLALAKLASHRHLHIAMVSGRRRASLMRHVGVPHIHYFGLYGWEGADGLPLSVKAATRALAQARIKLGNLPNKAPGTFIEDKGISLAVHFQEAGPAARRHAHAQLNKWLAHFHPHLHILRASNVWEIVPGEIRGKGVALTNMLKNVKTPFLPFYVGDDLTDESAFSALRAGVTVLVGPVRKTAARFILRNTGEVCTFLQKLEAELP